jgi:hypothetical protein
LCRWAESGVAGDGAAVEGAVLIEPGIFFRAGVGLDDGVGGEFFAGELGLLGCCREDGGDQNDEEDDVAHGRLLEQCLMIGDDHDAWFSWGSLQRGKPAGSSARTTAGMIASTTNETTHAAECRNNGRPVAGSHPKNLEELS